VVTFLCQGVVVSCLLNFIDQGGYLSMLAEVAHFMVRNRNLQFEFPADHVQHLYVLGDFLFREHAELQVQVPPLFGTTHLVFLVNENERRKENEFNSHNQGQKRKRIRIERSKPRGAYSIQDNPSNDEEDLSSNKARASKEASHAAAPSFRLGTVGDQLLLELGDRFNVPLGCCGDGGLR